MSTRVGAKCNNKLSAGVQVIRELRVDVFEWLAITISVQSLYLGSLIATRELEDELVTIEFGLHARDRAGVPLVQLGEIVFAHWSFPSARSAAHDETSARVG